MVSCVVVVVVIVGTLRESSRDKTRPTSLDYEVPSLTSSRSRVLLCHPERKARSSAVIEVSAGRACSVSRGRCKSICHHLQSICNPSLLAPIINDEQGQGWRCRPQGRQLRPNCLQRQGQGHPRTRQQCEVCEEARPPRGAHHARAEVERAGESVTSIHTSSSCPSC